MSPRVDGTGRCLVMCVVVAAACELFALGVSGLACAEPADAYRGRRLVDVFERFRLDGLDLIYSSAVVTGRLRITVEPTASDPREILLEILPPLGLRAKDGPEGSILILPATEETGGFSGRVVSRVERCRIL